MSILGLNLKIPYFSIRGRNPDLNKFIFTVKTDETGTSNNDQFTLPLESSFGTSVATPAIVEWGDGSTDTISSYNQAEITHTYSSAGSYTIKISDYMRGWKFNNSCLLYTSPSPRDGLLSRMPSSA